jgi:NDP-sugar pyrophosphorylase family protein
MDYPKQAMLLCAGHGSRLHPLTARLPKPMLPLNGRPLLAYTLELLRGHGIDRIAINLHHAWHHIVRYLGDGSAFGVEITYSWEEELLGSAGAVRKLSAFWEGPFFVLCGDLLTTADLPTLAAFHRRRQALATIAVHRAADPTRGGVVTLDADGRLTSFVEKPPGRCAFCAAGRTRGGLINAGIYLLDTAVLGHIPAGEHVDFGADLFPGLIAQGLPLFGCPVNGYLLDIGSLETYQRAQSAAPHLPIAARLAAATGA